MPRHIILAAGLDAGTRQTASQVIARENRWPLLDVETLSGTISPYALPGVLHEQAKKAVVERAQMRTLLDLMWAQVDADVDGVVLSAGFTEQVNNSEWIDQLNEHLDLHGYEATIAYVLTPGEDAPPLAPEHYLLGPHEEVEDLFASATHLAIELR